MGDATREPADRLEPLRMASPTLGLGKRGLCLLAPADVADADLPRRKSLVLGVARDDLDGDHAATLFDELHLHHPGLTRSQPVDQSLPLVLRCEREDGRADDRVGIATDEPCQIALNLDDVPTGVGDDRLPRGFDEGTAAALALSQLLGHLDHLRHVEQEPLDECDLACLVGDGDAVLLDPHHLTVLAMEAVHRPDCVVTLEEVRGDLLGRGDVALIDDAPERPVGEPFRRRVARELLDLRIRVDRWDVGRPLREIHREGHLLDEIAEPSLRALLSGDIDGRSDDQLE